MRSKAQASVIVPQEHKSIIRNTSRSCFLNAPRCHLAIFCDELVKKMPLACFACCYACVHCLQICVLMLAHTLKKSPANQYRGTAAPRRALRIIMD